MPEIFPEPFRLPDGAMITTVPPENYVRVLEVLEQAFPKTKRSFFYSITLQDPWYNPAFSLVVEKDGDFLAHIQIFDRSLQMGDRTLHVGGIGSVGTLPMSRGRGYASALMRHATEVMKQNRMVGGMLFTSIHAYYEKLGWRTLRQNEQEIAILSLQGWKPHTEGYRVLRAEDYPVLQAMYEAQQERVQGTLIRNQDYWRVRPQWMNHQPTVVLHEGRIAGYFYAAQYRLNDPIMTITEFGFSDASEEIFKRLLGVMASKAEEMQCHRLRGFFLHDPLFADFLKRERIVQSENHFDYVMWHDLGRGDFDEIQGLASHNRFLYWQTDAF